MADAFGDEADETVTINEYIEDLEAAELEADMVLGGDEGKECTYERGYMKRQAIFSCLTCVPSGSAGVCTACSLTCHDGHEIVELWTKRNFQCDCGNSKFGQFSCKLFANKDPKNLQNNYNQNFQGSYCICHRPYPDPEAAEQAEMIQCCICEDWFHENHIDLEPTEEIPRDEEGEPLYDDFICPDCSPKVSFLKLYPASIWASRHNKRTISNPEGKISENAADWKPSVKTENGSCCHAAEISTVGGVGPAMVSDGISDTNLIFNGDAACSKDTGPSQCQLEVNLSQIQVIFEKKKPLFPSKKWRENICRCHTCCELYTKSGVGYLIDEEDSMEEYEKIAKQKREEKLQKQEGAELNFINKLDHVQKIEILNGIADIKNELSTFMESFDSSKPITAADVHGIFENLAKKRQRLQ